MKYPPITGEQPLPVDKRPTCLHCGRPLKPWISHEWSSFASDDHRVVKRTFRGRYGYHNLFCGPNHAADWGLYIARKNIDSIREEQRRKQEKTNGHQGKQRTHSRPEA